VPRVVPEGKAAVKAEERGGSEPHPVAASVAALDVQEGTEQEVSTIARPRAEFATDMEREAVARARASFGLPPMEASHAS
jgi:hypothetical protein